MANADTLPDNVLSIAGEQFAARDEAIYADPGYVDTYVRDCSDGVAKCRQRRRHNYPPIPRQNIRFDDITSDGHMLREQVCEDCGCAKQTQIWEPYVTRSGGKSVTRFRFIANRTSYQKNEHGEEYVAHGHGLITPGMVRESLATQAMDEEAEKMANDALRQARTYARRLAAAAASGKAG